MCSKDEEDSKQVHYPRQGVQEVPASWCIFCNKEVEHGDDNSVATEHVVSTGMDTR